MSYWRGSVDCDNAILCISAASNNADSLSEIASVRLIIKSMLMGAKIGFPFTSKLSVFHIIGTISPFLRLRVSRV